MTGQPAPLEVLFLVRSLGIGGAERQLVTLAAELHRRGHRIGVLTYYGGGLLTEHLIQAGVPVFDAGKQSRWNVVGPLVRLAAAVRRFRPAILHGYLPDANILATILARLAGRCRVVWGVRASALVPGHYDWLTLRLFGLSCRLASRADLIIANSQAGRADHVGRGYPAERTIVIPNGIDTAHFGPDPAARARQRAAWRVAPHEHLIGLVGRLDPMKDHRTFLQAAGLAVKRSDVRFVAVGEGPEGYRSELMALADELGLGNRLIWARAQPDVAAVYNALDLLTLPSAFGEGFPNVVGEAMACGVRCVVTEVGDAAWIVGETGLIVKPGAPEQLCQAWNDALREPGGGDPRERIIAEFSVDRLVSRTEAALRAVEQRRAVVDPLAGTAA